MKKLLFGLMLLLSFSTSADSNQYSMPGQASGLFMSKLLYTGMNVAMVMRNRDMNDKPDYAFFHFEEMLVSDYVSIVTREVPSQDSDLAEYFEKSKGLTEVIKFLVTMTKGDITTKEAYEAFQTNKTVLELVKDLHEELNPANYDFPLKK